MLFKKFNFLLLSSFFLLPHCGLKIGENAPSSSPHRLTSSGDCSSLDYAKEFRSYFLEDWEENQPDNLSEGRLSKALDCISSTIEEIKNKISHEDLDKQELINLLNQGTENLSNMKPIINHIVDPVYLDDYIFIKDNVIYMIEEQKASRFVTADKVCHSQNNGITLSKQEVDTLLNFLGDMSEFSSKLEQSSEKVFNEFFKSNSLDPQDPDPYLLSKSHLEESNDFKNKFILFLSNHFQTDFPEYSEFLDRNFSEIEYDFAKLEWTHRRSIHAQRIADRSLKLRNDILQPLTAMAQLPPSSSNKLTVQNIKYIMLNIYIMKALFSIYDANQDSKLSPEELKPLSCLITPLTSVIMSLLLKDNDEWLINFLKDKFTPKTVTNYAIIHQKIPRLKIPLNLLDLWGNVDFLWNSLLYNSNVWNNPFSGYDYENLETFPDIDFSYIEMSNLISVLFSTFFHGDIFNLREEPPPSNSPFKLERCC